MNALRGGECGRGRDSSTESWQFPKKMDYAAPNPTVATSWCTSVAASKQQTAPSTSWLGKRVSARPVTASRRVI